MDIPIDQILPNPEQPRKTFDPLELDQLKESILQNGVILPVAVEEAGKERYILHDGERRWRAARLAGLAVIPATVMPSLNGRGKEERLVRALVANIQRSDLNPIEEGQGFAELLKIGLTQNEIALRLGISAATVNSCLMLLKLEKPIQELVASGKLSKDRRLVTLMLEQPDSKLRVRTARALAEKQVTLKGCMETFRRLNEQKSEDVIAAGDVPAIQLASRKTGAVRRPTWDLFASVGKVPPWLLVEISARNVCDRCGLRDQASAKNCRGCVLVEVLTEMLGAVQG